MSEKEAYPKFSEEWFKAFREADTPEHRQEILRNGFDREAYEMSLNVEVPPITASRMWHHFKTITHHKILVMVHCFKVGLYKQGLTHDLSKYAPTELLVGARFYQGTRSPNTAERTAKGYSASWLHHKGRNKHHFEYWIDMKANGDATLEGKKMPVRYVVEMLCDRLAASKVYSGSRYTDQSALDYFRLEQSVEGTLLLHPETAALLEYMLTLVAEKGEKVAFAHIKRAIVKPSRRHY